MNNLVEIRRNSEAKYEVYYKAKLISTQNNLVKATEKLFKYMKSQS